MQPGFWDNQNEARKIIDQTNAVKAIIEPYDKLVSQLDDAEVLLEMSEIEDDEAQLKAIHEEFGSLAKDIKKQTDQLETRSLLGGKLDPSNCYLSINAGAGGTESCDWADMLSRLFSRYCERNGYDWSVMDFQKGDEAGIKSISALVSGSFAFGMLKSERGVHRLVRISPFDSAKRRHTSFVAVDIVAEVDEDFEIEILDKDLRIDTYRASGAGGQHVNTTDSAVRITHQPTGIVVQCQAERSQHSNRDRAMKMLKANLYEYELDQKRQESEKVYGDKGAIAWGSQIRSYVLQPYTMVKDHRTNTEYSNVNAVLDGDIDPFIQAYLKHERSNQSDDGDED